MLTRSASQLATASPASVAQSSGRASMRTVDDLPTSLLEDIVRYAADEQVQRQASALELGLVSKRCAMSLLPPHARRWLEPSRVVAFEEIEVEGTADELVRRTRLLASLFTRGPSETCRIRHLRRLTVKCGDLLDNERQAFESVDSFLTIIGLRAVSLRHLSIEDPFLSPVAAAALSQLTLSSLRLKVSRVAKMDDSNVLPEAFLGGSAAKTLVSLNVSRYSDVFSVRKLLDGRPFPALRILKLSDYVLHDEYQPPLHLIAPSLISISARSEVIEALGADVRLAGQIKRMIVENWRLEQDFRTMSAFTALEHLTWWGKSVNRRVLDDLPTTICSIRTDFSSAAGVLTDWLAAEPARCLNLRRLELCKWGRDNRHSPIKLQKLCIRRGISLIETLI